MNSLRKVARVVIQQILRAQSKLEVALNFTGALVIFLIMLSVTAEVLMRKFANKPIPGQFDGTELAMAVCIFAGLAYAQASYSHIRMGIVINKLKGRRRFLLESLGTVIGIVIAVVIVYWGWQSTMDSFHSGDVTISTGLPVAPSRLFVPLGGLILAFRLFLQLVTYAHLVVQPSAEPLTPLQISAEEEGLG